MTKEEKLLRGITAHLQGYAKAEEKDYKGVLSDKEMAELKAQKSLALEVLIRFNLCEYTEAVPPHTGE